MISSHRMGLSHTDRVMRECDYIQVSQQQQRFSNKIIKPTSAVIAMIVNIQLVNLTSKPMYSQYLS
jgi:hypothetical protein